MHTLKTIALGILLTFAAGTTVYAEKCKGKWGGRVSTSVKFKDGNAFRYCYKNECSTHTYKGNKNGVVKTTFGNGAKLTLTKNADGYAATYVLNGRTSRAKMRCR